MNKTIAAGRTMVAAALAPAVVAWVARGLGPVVVAVQGVAAVLAKDLGRVIGVGPVAAVALGPVALASAVDNRGRAPVDPERPAAPLALT